MSKLAKSRSNVFSKKPARSIKIVMKEMMFDPSLIEVRKGEQVVVHGQLFIVDARNRSLRQPAIPGPLLVRHKKRGELTIPLTSRT